MSKTGQFAHFIKNRLYRGDCLDVMRRLRAEKIAPSLIYLDPPFNSGRDYSIIFRGGEKDARQAAFSDTWEKTRREEAARDIAAVAADVEGDGRLVKLLRAWDDILGGGRAGEKGLLNYLLYMAPRLLWCNKILSADGGVYLHCDPTASHYLKTMADLIFGRAHFRNEIVWCYGSPSNARAHFPRKHDVILFYAKSGHAFNWEDVLLKHKRVDKQVAGGWHKAPRADGYVRGKKCPDWWIDIPPAGKIHSEYAGYPTQKPLALLERIIRASSAEGGLVFDPFCGCGTTIHAAHSIKRRWIGADISPRAVLHAQSRIKKHLFLSADDYDLLECGAQPREEYARPPPRETRGGREFGRKNRESQAVLRR